MVLNQPFVFRHLLNGFGYHHAPSIVDAEQSLVERPVKRSGQQESVSWFIGSAEAEPDDMDGLGFDGSPRSHCDTAYGTLSTVFLQKDFAECGIARNCIA